MPINFDTALGIHEQALFVRQRRTEVLASNIANADTPGYRAREVDFRAALQQAGVDPVSVNRTSAGHMSLDDNATAPYELYRIPDQPSVDGNTVDVQQEKAAVADNNVRYQATLMFLTRRFAGMVSAFKGE